MREAMKDLIDKALALANEQINADIIPWSIVDLERLKDAAEWAATMLEQEATTPTAVEDPDRSCGTCKHREEHPQSEICKPCKLDGNRNGSKWEPKEGGTWTANDTPAMEELKKLGVDDDVIGFEFEEEDPTARSCTTCQHEDSPAKRHPCRFCGDSPTGEPIYWESKEG